MLHQSIAATLVGRGVIYVDGSRYYTPETAARLGARGSLHLYDFDGSRNALRLEHANYAETRYLDVMTPIVGDGDVWWTTEFPRSYDPPNPLATTKQIVELSIDDWWRRNPPETLIVDWHIILHSRGSGGGRRGLMIRPELVKVVEVPEISSTVLSMIATNLVPESTKPVREWVVRDKIWVAGRGVVFTNEAIAQDAAEAGAAGIMPGMYEPMSRKLKDTIRRDYERRLGENATQWPTIVRLLEGKD